MVSRQGLNADAAGREGDDAILPFQLDGLAIRGRVARLDRVLDRILAPRDYPPSVAALVGEAALITAMVGSALKLRGRFSMQARGEGPVRMIATDYIAPPEDAPERPALLRAYAHFDAEATPEETAAPAALLGDGVLAMTIDQGRDMRPYQGLTPLSAEAMRGGGLGAAAEAYFAQSEQLATGFAVSVGSERGPQGTAWRAGGVMIQHLAAPGESARPPERPSGADGLMSAADVASMTDSEDDWRQASLLLATADALELVGPHVSPEQLLIRLFHEVGPRAFPAMPVAFGCSCSAEAVEAVLRRYGRAELADMATEDGLVEASCEFCGAVYRFSPDLGATEPD